MPTLLEKIAEQTAQSKADALASYRAILHRESAGQSQKDDAAKLVRCLDTLGLTVAEAEADLQALRTAAETEASIPPQGELDAALADATAAMQAYTAMESRHREELKTADSARLTAIAKSRLLRDRTQQGRQALAELRAGHPRVFVA